MLMQNSQWSGEGLWTAFATSVGFTASTLFNLTPNQVDALGNFIITIIVGVMAGWLKTRRRKPAPRKRKTPTP